MKKNHHLAMMMRMHPPPHVRLPPHDARRFDQWVMTSTKEASKALQFPTVALTMPRWESLRVRIVYFANTLVNRAHGVGLIVRNLSDLISSGILQTIPNCHVHLVLTVHHQLLVERRVMQSIPTELRSKFTTHITLENAHEFPGIAQVHALGNDVEPVDAVLYFHSKNMTRFDGKHEDAIGRKIMEDLVLNWRYCLFVLHNFESIDKVVSTCSPEGWGWYNYWWVRGTYLRNMNAPDRTSDRWYYESWLARAYRGPHDPILNCWSMSTSPKKGFHNVGTTYQWYESPFQEPVSNAVKAQTASVMRHFQHV